MIRSSAQTSVLGLALLVSGCLDGPSFFKQSPTARLLTETEHNVANPSEVTTEVEAKEMAPGVSVAKVDPSSKTTQLMRYNGQALPQETSVAFPPGALTIATEVRIESGTNLAASFELDELAISSETDIVVAGGAVVVQASENIDALQPFTVALAIPDGRSLQLLQDEASLFYAVLFHVSLAAEGGHMLGLIPQNELTIEGGIVRFQTRHFGQFQVVVTRNEVIKRQEVPTKFAVTSSRTAQALPLEIITRSPLVATSGDRIVLRGKNFRPSLRLAANNRKLGRMNVVSDTEAHVYMDDGHSAGLLLATASQDGVEATVSLVYRPDTDYPVIGLPSTEICTGTKYYDLEGRLVEGSRHCDGLSTPETCTTSGQVGCMATDALPATAPIKTCTEDGQTGCIATNTFPAAKLSNFEASDVRSGITVAGIKGTQTLNLPSHDKVLAGTSYGDASKPLTGSLTLPDATNVRTANGPYGAGGSSHTPTLADCSTDGATGCVTTTTYKAADMSHAIAENIKSAVAIAGVTGTFTGNFSPCTGDGQMGCITTSEFPSADTMTTAVASHIKSGITIAGVLGTLTEESHTNCSADGATGCVTTATFKAANMSTFSSSNVQSGYMIAGVSGSLLPEAHSDCSVDGEVGCVTVPAFKAADMSAVTAGHVKKGVTIAGVIGDYPSATNPLAGDTATPDLTNFITQVTVDGVFEYWDSSGVHHTGSGDSDIAEANIMSGITFENLGITGTAAHDCSADGEIGCLTTPRYKAMDTDASVISEWDIRKGKTAGGIAGEITFFKNMADTSVFDRITGTGALSGVDVYDTIDDYNATGTFPTTAPSGWDQATGANWLRDLMSDDGAGGGVASNGICDGSEACVFSDKITGLSWSKSDATAHTWENGVTYCDGLSLGTHTDWRLPTQKELMQAYTNGISSVKDSTKLNISPSDYWSSSTYSNSTTSAWTINLELGLASYSPKTNTAFILCVR